MEFMIERLGYSDVYLYRQVESKWQFKKHLSNFPAQEQAG